MAFSCKSKGSGCHSFQSQGFLPTGATAEFGTICCCDSNFCNGADLVFPEEPSSDVVTSPATITVTTGADLVFPAEPSSDAVTSPATTTMTSGADIMFPEKPSSDAVTSPATTTMTSGADLVFPEEASSHTVTSSAITTMTTIPLSTQQVDPIEEGSTHVESSVWKFYFILFFKIPHCVEQMFKLYIYLIYQNASSVLLEDNLILRQLSNQTSPRQFKSAFHQELSKLCIKWVLHP